MIFSTFVFSVSDGSLVPSEACSVDRPYSIDSYVDGVVVAGGYMVNLW